jgi:hypothetical protein
LKVSLKAKERKRFNFTGGKVPKGDMGMLQPKTKETKLIPNDELNYKLSVVSEESSQSGGEIPIMEDVFLESISIYDNPNDLQLREEAKIAEKNKVFKAKKRALILEHIDGEIEG